MANDRLGGWNHLPEIPIQVSPFFTWPPDPVAMVKWVWGAWFGSFHDGTVEANTRMQERRKRITGK